MRAWIAWCVTIFFAMLTVVGWHAANGSKGLLLPLYIMPLTISPFLYFASCLASFKETNSYLMKSVFMAILVTPILVISFDEYQHARELERLRKQYDVYSPNQRYDVDPNNIVLNFSYEDHNNDYVLDAIERLLVSQNVSRVLTRIDTSRGSSFGAELLQRKNEDMVFAYELLEGSESCKDNVQKNLIHYFVTISRQKDGGITGSLATKSYFYDGKCLALVPISENSIPPTFIEIRHNATSSFHPNEFRVRTWEALGFNGQNYVPLTHTKSGCIVPYGKILSRILPAAKRPCYGTTLTLEGFLSRTTTITLGPKVEYISVDELVSKGGKENFITFLRGFDMPYYSSRAEEIATEEYER